MTREGLLEGIEAATEAALEEVHARDRVLATRARDLVDAMAPDWIEVDGERVLAEDCPGCEGHGEVGTRRPGGGPRPDYDCDHVARCRQCGGLSRVPVICEECGKARATRADRLCGKCAGDLGRTS